MEATAVDVERCIEMMQCEFEKLTKLTVSEDDYINVIEPKYMNSKRNKQSWCKQYINSLKQDKKAVNKKYLKDCLKEWLDNWYYSKKEGVTHYDTDSSFTIKYENGDIVYISEYDYDGEKVRLQGIVNISMICSECHMDFYYDWIGDQENYDTWLELGFNVPKNRYVVKDINDYYKEFETFVLLGRVS